ncbi:L-2,4-diaminobutyrate decarboxylase [Cyphellophora attinorum]|uniref:L-2,4-diaminobutyrate decarboxylase n=1 Tax=Cyphellophora attinorum TaxID=1664694 RepID=A0A0N0NM81_9EURO|nr:L-2,4-diaminobutyrate decarboxylase [Phialophora attinorum]KPI40151.1 L-2,4-diaminobutyrate decarboxylase [Phialophora attinorum]
MEAPTSLTQLLMLLHNLVRTQKNLPQELAPGVAGSNSPLPQHDIPGLPIASSSLSEQPLALKSALSPNYYGFVTGGSTPAALLADWLVSLYDQNVQVHLPRETISTTVEVAALNQLVDLFRLPRETWGVGSSSSHGGGTFTTGATASNILGLALGREWVIQQHANDINVSVGNLGLIDAMRYAGLYSLRVLTTLPHSSIAKAASVVGIGRCQVTSVIKEGTDLDIDLDAVERYASEPGTGCILVISAGEVNTGRFATLGSQEGGNQPPVWQQLGEICDRYNVWVHVDGAFGLFGRALLPDPSSARQNGDGNAGADTDYSHILNGVTGLEHLADSVTGDAHKLLNVPYDCGFFFTRHKDLSEQVFVNGGAAYLAAPASAPAAESLDVSEEEGGRGGGAEGGFRVGDAIQSPLNIGLENSRRFRALPVHATLIAYGREGYVGMLRRQIGLARHIVRFLWNHPDYDVLPQDAKMEDEAVMRTFIIVLFRAKDEKVNEVLVERINASGKIYVSGTRWKGEKAARIAVSSWMADVEQDGKLVEGVLGEVVK